MKYIQFMQLCWKAYNGDPKAAIEVLKILAAKAKVGAVVFRDRLDG